MLSRANPRYNLPGIQVKSLFKEGNGHNRRWTLRNAIETLKQLTRNQVTAHGAEFFQISKATLDQERIMTLLDVKIS